MIYTHEVQQMCSVAKGPNHGPAPIPEEGKWIQAKEVKDISGLTHGVGWCAPQQGACKLTLNVKDGIIEEALVETLGKLNKLKKIEISFTDVFPTIKFKICFNFFCYIYFNTFF